MIYVDQLDTFRAFKRAGAIPQNARRVHYSILWSEQGASIWRTGIRHRGSYALWEREIASASRAMLGLEPIRLPEPARWPARVRVAAIGGLAYV